MKKQGPTIESLRALAMFVETGGVRAAARRLGTSQPVVTRKLNAFKKGGNCGAILLAERGQSLELTDAGHGAMPLIRELLRQYDQLLDYTRGESSSIHRVVFATGHFGAEYYLPRVLDPQLSREIRMEIRVVRGRERILGVADGRFDLGLVSHAASDVIQILRDERTSAEAIEIEPLHAQLMVIIASPETMAGKELQAMPIERSVPISRLRSWELLGLDQDSGVRRQLETHFSHGERICFLTEGGGWSAARELSRRKLGVGVVPLATLSLADQKEFVVRRLSGRFAIEKSVIYRTQELSPGSQRVLKQLKVVARQHQAEVQDRWDQWLRTEA